MWMHRMDEQLEKLGASLGSQPELRDGDLPNRKYVYRNEARVAWIEVWKDNILFEAYLCTGTAQGHYVGTYTTLADALDGITIEARKVVKRGRFW